MTDEATAAAAETDANAPGTSLTERAHVLVAQMEHNMAHNAPISLEMLREVKALLGLSAE